MTDLHIPDISEWQANVDWPTLAKARPAVILRAHNGHRADRQFAARLVQARRYMKVRLFYGYMVAGRDAATQGRELAATVGKLQPGEAFVCDVEEGSGDQSGRVKAYLAALAGRDIVYSGGSFAHDHLAATLKTSGVLFWDAAYRSTEPSTHHFLWQHTDHEPTPGIGKTDCSIYHGTVQQLHDLLSPPATRPAPHPAPAPAPSAKPSTKPTPAPSTAPSSDDQEPDMHIIHSPGHSIALVTPNGKGGISLLKLSDAESAALVKGGVRRTELSDTEFMTYAALEKRTA